MQEHFLYQTQNFLLQLLLSRLLEQLKSGFKFNQDLSEQFPGINVNQKTQYNLIIII